MRKLYSLVLLAVGLLIGTNAWGQSSTVQLVNHTNPSASKGYATLQDAIDAVAPGDTATITLSEDQNLTASIVIPNAVGESAQTFAARGKVVGRQPQRICLNLNGNNIEGDGALNQCCIALLKGVLHITGEGEIKKQGTEKGTNSGWGRAAIAISGAPGNKNDDSKDFSKKGWWSTLIIDENVKVTAPDNFKSVGLAIMDLGGYMGTYYVGNQNFPAFIGVRQSGKSEDTDKLGYSDYNIYLNNDTQAKKDALNIMWSRASNQNGDGTLQGSAFGVRVIVKGEIYGMNRGIFVFGPINQHPEDFPTDGAHKETRTRYTIGAEHPYYYEHYFPWITIEKTAKVHCMASGTDDEEAGGVYAAGWAVFDISGEVYGQNGLYIKSGDIQLHDANIYSQDPQFGDDGWRNGKVAGNGIFMTTDAQYAGDINVEVNGDSRIAGNGGAAIVEVVASTETTPDVNNITINGGTIEGGSTGAILVTEPTGEKTVAYGGTSITGATKKGGTTSSVAATGTYKTEVTDPVTNKTTIVISDLAGNSVETVTENLAQTTEDYVKWTGAADQYILEDKTLEYLEMNPSPAVAQKIYVGDATHQATLTVDRVVMGSLAQIIVAPGSKLIITGTDGIVAPKTSNIVLQTSGSKQAEFLFNPLVSSNKHPNATIEMQAKVGKLTVGTEEYREWHRFAVPVLEIKEFGKNPNWSTYLYAWDYVNDDWYKPSSPLEIMKPFEGFTLSPVNDYGDITYTFKGQLVGNDNHNLKFVKEGFNFFGNSYTAYMSVEKLIDQLTEDGSDFEPTIWTWYSNHYHAVPLKALEEDANAFNDNQKQIKPMQTFILRLVDANEAETELNYKDAIWGNPRYASLIPNAAPARHAVSNDNTFMRIILSAGEDNADDVMFMEQSKFSDAIDKGYDASKFMNEQGVNIFATVDGSNFSAVATDNVEGKMLSIRTANEAIYTLSFSNVNGAEYAIRDNVTNQVIAIEEGASYEFAAQPNSVIENRFEIIPIAKVPTAIENAGVMVNKKGIYTITGQYLGEDFEALPAGVYVVNGVKIVK